MEQNEKITPRPRLRFAKSEIVKLLTAVEEADAGDIDLGMRCIDLEERLKYAGEQTARWRRSFDGLKEIIAATGDERLKQIEQAMRVWCSEA